METAAVVVSILVMVACYFGYVAASKAINERSHRTYGYKPLTWPMSMVMAAPFVFVWYGLGNQQAHGGVNLAVGVIAAVLVVGSVWLRIKTRTDVETAFQATGLLLLAGFAIIVAVVLAFWSKCIRDGYRDSVPRP